MGSVDSTGTVPSVPPAPLPAPGTNVPGRRRGRRRAPGREPPSGTPCVVLVGEEGRSNMRTRLLVRSSVVALAASGALTLVAVAPAGASGRDTVYQRHDLVSDVKGAATIQDTTLVNAWGMSQGPSTPVWVSDNGTDATTLYTGDGVVGPITKVPLTVVHPRSRPDRAGLQPDDRVRRRRRQGPCGAALFIFASESGDITGWNPAVPPPAPSTQAQLGSARRRRHLQGPGHGHRSRRIAAAVRGQLPRRHDRRLRRLVPAHHVARCLQGPEAAQALRAVQRRRARTASCTSPTPCRTPTPRTRSPVRARGSSTCSTPPGTSSGGSSRTAR